jgi:hypothetical protein
MFLTHLSALTTVLTLYSKRYCWEVLMKNNSGNVAVANATSLDEIKTYTTETKRAFFHNIADDDDGWVCWSDLLTATSKLQTNSGSNGNDHYEDRSSCCSCCSAPQPIGQFINS